MHSAEWFSYSYSRGPLPRLLFLMEPCALHFPTLLYTKAHFAIIFVGENITSIPPTLLRTFRDTMAHLWLPECLHHRKHSIFQWFIYLINSCSYQSLYSLRRFASKQKVEFSAMKLEWLPCCPPPCCIFKEPTSVKEKEERKDFNLLKLVLSQSLCLYVVLNEILVRLLHSFKVESNPVYHPRLTLSNWAYKMLYHLLLKN